MGEPSLIHGLKQAAWLVFRFDGIRGTVERAEIDAHHMTADKAVGPSVVIASRSMKVNAQLIRLQELRELPVLGAIRGDRTRQGHWQYTLQPVAADAEPNVPDMTSIRVQDPVTRCWHSFEEPPHSARWWKVPPP